MGQCELDEPRIFPVETRMFPGKNHWKSVRFPMDQSIAWTNVSEYLGLDG